LVDRLMSQVRDIFFEEFYRELERVVAGLRGEELRMEMPLQLVEALRRRWHEYEPSEDLSPLTLIGVDGGVQQSRFSHGWTVSVGRACALIRSPGEEALRVRKRVKIHIGRIFDDRDRAYIPSYVRLIAEYGVASEAAEEVVEAGGRPLVLMDGSLYLSRFPYAEREYLSHPRLLAELFEAMASLHILARDHGFPVVALAKDSTVFYLYMALLREILALSGIDGNLASIVAESPSPLSLRGKMGRLEEGEREVLEGLLGGVKPLCDQELVETSVDGPGFTHPLLLAPSIYYRRGDAVPSLYRRVRELLPGEEAERVVSALEAFFSRPPVAVTYWRPRRGARPFRLDISASSLGYGFPMKEIRRNAFVVEGRGLDAVREVLDHLGFWFCNPLEYNLPLRQADRLARFDRQLYASRYEPFIIKRMEERGVTLLSRVRDLREVVA